MKRALSTLGAATLLIGLPLAAAAHDDDRDRGWRGHERHGHYNYHQPKYKQLHKHYQAPPVVYYPAPPRVVQRPVYVPVPPPPPRPWPFNHVDIGFRVFF
jgi:hypothetical protein